ncbi:hypothetical protein ACFL2T_07875, partial [Elusimicrobiota bacterium]
HTAFTFPTCSIRLCETPGAHDSLTPEQIEKLDSALILMGTTASGKQIIIAVVPDSNGNVDLEALRNAGVDVRAAPDGTVSGGGQVTEAQGADKVNFTHIITLDQSTLDEKSEIALTSQLGMNMNDVAFWRQWGDRVSQSLMEQVGKVKAVWLSLELKSTLQQTMFSNSPLTKNLNYWTVIWEDDLENRGAWGGTDNAKFGATAGIQYNTIRDHEINDGIRGAPAFWWLGSSEARQADARNIGSRQHAYKQRVRNRVETVLSEQDKVFRRTNGHPPLPQD